MTPASGPQPRPLLSAAAAATFAVLLLAILAAASPARVAAQDCASGGCGSSSSRPDDRAPSAQPRPPTPPPAAPIVPARTIWDHNGSVMLLVANADRRSFYYQLPRSGMAAQNVVNGTLLYDGTVVNGEWVGTARRFSARCGIRQYAVRGRELEGGRIVMLQGTAPRIDGRCRVTQQYQDTLVFTFLRSDTPR